MTQSLFHYKVFCKSSLIILFIIIHIINYHLSYSSLKGFIHAISQHIDFINFTVLLAPSGAQGVIISDGAYKYFVLF